MAASQSSHGPREILNLPPRHAQAKPLGAEAELEARAHALCGLRVERGQEREQERVDAELASGQRRGAAAPAREREDHRLEPATPLRQLVDGRVGRWSELAPLNRAAVLELVQALREHVGARARQPRPQVGEALGAEDELAHHQERPALAHAVQSPGDAAGIVVAAQSGHARSMSLTSGLASPNLGLIKSTGAEPAMRKLTVFNLVSLDGYFTDANGDMSWAHKSDPEWDAFTVSNAETRGGMLLFGRVTYQLMASYWPTPMAKQQAPVVAGAMNELPKVVFSRTLKEASWQNTRLVKTGMVEEVRALKSGAVKDGATGRDVEQLVIMGSGSVVSQLAQNGLIDEYQIVVCPLVLGRGRTMFEGIDKRLALKLTKTRAFANGNVLVCYEAL